MFFFIAITNLLRTSPVVFRNKTTQNDSIGKFTCNILIRAIHPSIHNAISIPKNVHVIDIV